MPVQIRPRYTKSGDVNIAWAEFGDGPVDVVFVTGFVGHLEIMWEEPRVARFFERLGSFARVVIFDKRGQGLSDRPATPPALEEHMDDLRAVMDAAGLERAALFSISEGGPMAIMFAASHPDRVTSLVLYGTWARLIEEPGYEEGIPRKLLEDTAMVFEEDWGGPVALPIFAPNYVDDASLSHWWARLLRGGTSPRGASALLLQYGQMDVSEALSSISSPTLVLHRSGDIAIPVNFGRAIAEGIEGARFVELPGEDHLVMVGDGDGVLDEVEDFLTGHRHVHEPDRVLATVLFTDIVGSTERAARTGDRGWRELMERHDRLVRRELERYRGRPVKTMGDGFLATFDGPARAIRAARSIADGVAQLGLELRAGVHTGELELVGDDVAGMTVNIGARVSALAGPGEVLVSRTVKDLVVGSGLEFEERGSHELKGVPGDWSLYAVAR
jgi:class 3 adenylate cyclase